MAHQDASIAIKNTLQKLNEQPNIVQKNEELKSAKTELHRLGTRLNRLKSFELTQVREFAYDVEDAMDNSVMVDTNMAQRRWRTLGILFSLRANKMERLVEKQMEGFGERTASIGRSNIDGDDHEISCEESNETTERDPDTAEIPNEKEVLYLSLSGFPADVVISARQLVQVWFAEAFRKDGHGSPIMEDQLRDCVDRLLQEGLILEERRGTSGSLKTFKIVNDKLDACREAAEKEGFLQVKHNEDENNESISGNAIEEFCTAAPDITGTSETNISRLVIHIQSKSRQILDVKKTYTDYPKVRSLRINCASRNKNEPVYDISKRFLETLRKGFRFLRVLDLGYLEMEAVPDMIGKLTYLRYLRLKAPKATKIPSSICDLQHLQTIDMKETERMKTIPGDIWKLDNLRHLHLGGATALPAPRRINHYKALAKLQTLCGVYPDKELKRLMVRAKFPNLKRLRLHTSKSSTPTNEDGPAVSFLNSLDHLYHLRSLTINGAIKSLPSDWNAFPLSLTKMTLLKTRIPADECMKTLQNVANLRFLKLMDNSLTGPEIKCAAGKFSALQVLIMEKLEELKTWRLEKGAMRYLKRLEVRDCKTLEKVEAVQPLEELRKILEDKAPEVVFLLI